MFGFYCNFVDNSCFVVVVFSLTVNLPACLGACSAGCLPHFLPSYLSFPSPSLPSTHISPTHPFLSLFYHSTPFLSPLSTLLFPSSSFPNISLPFLHTHLLLICYPLSFLLLHSLPSFLSIPHELNYPPSHHYSSILHTSASTHLLHELVHF